MSQLKKLVLLLACVMVFCMLERKLVCSYTGFRCVVYEGGSLNIVRVIYSKLKDFLYLDLVIDDCQNCCILFLSFTLNRFKRFANVSAHHLVILALSFIDSN
jgi:hypothetical protein